MTEEETVKKTGPGNVRKYADNILPMARIKKIMKMDPNITDNINVEATYLVCAAAEMFIKQLSKEVYKMDSRCLTYSNLAKFVQKDDKLDFLHAIVPNKITVKEYKKILSEETEKTINGNSESEDTSESESDEESDESGEEEEEEEEEVEAGPAKKQKT